MKDVQLSAIILAKNAEELIGECLQSVAFCDEIIVVDTGSTDTTIAIAKKHGARVVRGVDGNFAENRNIGMREAKGEWLLYVDTDERVSPELRKEIQSAIQNGTDAAYRLERKNFYLGNHPWPKIELLERLFKKSQLREWYGALHETAKVAGSIGQLHGFLLHYTHRDLASMLEKTIAWSPIEAQLRFDANHPKIVTWRLIRVMLTGFWNSYITQGGWKAGVMGWVESIYQGYSMFITYATLWEMQQKEQLEKKKIV